MATIANSRRRRFVTIDTIEQDGATVIKAAGPVSDGSVCDPQAVTLTTSSVDWDVPAEDDAEFTLANAVNMHGDAGNQCQGATFEIPVTFSGASDAS